MCCSTGEAESMVRKGGLYVNFERVQSADELFYQDKHVLVGNTTLVRIGQFILSGQACACWEH